MRQQAADFFSQFDRIRGRIDQAWRQMGGPPGSPHFSGPLIEPSIDVYETDDEVVVMVEIAGISGEEVSVEIDGRTLTVSGERRPRGNLPRRLYSQMEICHGPFERIVILPADVGPDEAQAKYEDGMLEILLPKVGRKLKHKVRIVAR